MNPEAFLADVLDEPRTLDALLDACAGEPPPALPDGARVVLIGMGSSRFAALTAATALRARGVDAVAEYASTGVPAPPRPGTIAIGISASGRTEETVEALARHRGVSRTIAMTNHPDRALAAVADEVVALHAGEETGGVSCKTFQATLALLHLMAGAPLDALRPAVAAQAALLEARSDWLEPLIDLLAGPRTIYAIAPAERISSALESALMLREGPRVPADGNETGDWLHVDVYLSKHAGYRALLFPGSRFDAGLMEWARERRSSIVAVGAPVEGAAMHIPYPDAGDPLVASLFETTVAEVTAAVMWQRQAAAA
jgi:glutamine---fructose-6-phosphate transaminase (isomerizing)